MSDASDTELMGSSISINHIPNLPKLLITDIENVQDKCNIAISNMFLLDFSKSSRADQKALQSSWKVMVMSFQVSFMEWREPRLFHDYYFEPILAFNTICKQSFGTIIPDTWNDLAVGLINHACFAPYA
ncbi:uncharacterized protein EV154DRAFT_482380 [Mucor mucedo]|uniref:uncharacterized protein n=1 Tax=Mucor mucedo TaxID=29922 RepID=UPI00221E83F1|nr:uncharacterized protein EV154DRAFT_482380 [Mucor mucedo]KAI7890237.1 hypothetical protein EV154DRAFT_482380 [Mucor mucedo]